MKITGQQPVTWNRITEVYRQYTAAKDKYPQATDSLQISPEGRLLLELKALAAGLEGSSEARVEAIRARLAAGTYSIPVEDVAAALLKEIGW
ncbi:MAG: flagellar biosynthesis anti-sigma factor FlgM [Moorella sp. (in: Bacteria)]|nr:flagellar biosynthesis anti-sigma factor FlgM [Moorella sp. (in: firmicutes)]